MEDSIQQLFFNNDMDDMDFSSFSDLHSKPIDAVLLEGMQALPFDIFDGYHQQQFQDFEQNQFCNFSTDISGFDQPPSPFTIMSSSPKSSNASINIMSSPEQQMATSPAITNTPAMLLTPPVSTIDTSLPIISNMDEFLSIPAIIDSNTTNTMPDEAQAFPQQSQRSTKEMTPQPKKTIKAKKGRKRRTAQDLPYAPNLLNLNLSPSKRNTRTTHNNNTSAQRSPTPFRCDYPGCEKTFTRPYNLKSHRRTHTAERPYGCNVCTKRFARQHDRNRHTKLHFGIKPYICNLCNKAFARQDALNRHQRPDSKVTVNGSYSILSCANTGHRQRQPRKKPNFNNA
ncbi:hypothetical protein INT45_002170 [Circinella minor]|uniref:C2H2-type domain-containing protein n=1 Tax=Circinella minor TaxID=1195481 RepID=A0A8H7RZF8_9FUNG|nr:hypothetical protein INT45_002170 [Circinella minor]